jgi:hypothetical protein
VLSAAVFMLLGLVVGGGPRTPARGR